jgi:CxxC motif-containing protein (DUF1111 family)
MRNLTALALALTLNSSMLLPGQTDPGPRNGPPRSGQPLRNLSADELQAFAHGRDVFAEIDDVVDGLGPRFNLDSCAGCHTHPAVGGSSGPVNIQPRVALKFGAVNRIPPFIQTDGPTRVVRFKRDQNGNTDGGVRDLFVITGRRDAPDGCSITQPDFSNPNNLSFRIPTPTFGLGLIEAIGDSTLRANLAATAQQRRQMGIQGRFNTNGNDGTITRFGWKAQNKSLLLFSAEAYNVEIGVTNELFPQEREEDPRCAANNLPESHGDIAAQADFMRLLAPPAPAQPTDTTTRGAAIFQQIGCALCHTPSLTTGKSVSPALGSQTVNLYSDLAIHRMGQALDDNITQGNALGQDWRTAPLWGLGDRIFFLHDGRTKDLLEAIHLHDSPGSEAHQVILQFNALTPAQTQDLLDFLRSL